MYMKDNARQTHTPKAASDFERIKLSCLGRDSNPHCKQVLYQLSYQGSSTGWAPPSISPSWQKFLHKSLQYTCISHFSCKQLLARISAFDGRREKYIIYCKLIRCFSLADEIWFVSIRSPPPVLTGLLCLSQLLLLSRKRKNSRPRKWTNRLSRTRNPFRLDQ